MFSSSPTAEIKKIGSPQKQQSRQKSPARSHNRSNQELNTLSLLQAPLSSTLPQHSPHSPLHHQSQSVIHHNKLSSRYINNNKMGSSSPSKTVGIPTSTTNTFEEKNSSKCACTTSLSSTSASATASTLKNKSNMSSNGLRFDTTKSFKSNEKTDGQSIDLNDISLPPPPPPPTVSAASSLICSCEKLKNPKKQVVKRVTGRNRDVSTSPTTINAHIHDEVSTNKIKDICTDTNSTDKETKPNSALASPNTRRLVATRNAATSPNLDMRKIGTIITASTKTAGKKNAKQKKPSAIAMAIGEIESELVIEKTALEKSNSLGDSKPQKLLRTTRSLSPRPPVRHQQAIIVSDENDIVVSVKVSPNEEYEQKVSQEAVTRSKWNIFGDELNTNAVTVADNWKSTKIEKDFIGRQHRKHKAKSEQTSPNITDISDIKFSYNRLNNRSTGCLVYVPTDPWLKMPELDNVENKSTKKITKKDIRNVNVTSMDTTILKDPWIRRKPGVAETKNAGRTTKQDRFREIKSFSATKLEIDRAIIGTRPRLQRSKPSLYNDDDDLVMTKASLQSAPSSPHFLTASDNPFSSEFSINYQNTKKGTPPVSAYNSPTRTADGYYLNEKLFQQNHINSPPPSISVAALSSGKQHHSQQQQQQQSSMNNIFLDVCNPNLLQARHSFSSISSPISQRDDELQLNIRRLSEQMRKTQNTLSGSAIISISDKNLNGSGKQTTRNITTALQQRSTVPNRADFSDYLQQFRCSEAKKATAAGTRFNSDISANSSYKSQTNIDSMLETTC